MNAGAAGPGDEAAFKAWLARVVVDDRLEEPTKLLAEARDQALESVPASYVRRAIIGPLDGRQPIRSGIEARGMRFTGDLHLENLEILFPLFFAGCVFEGAIFGNGARTKTLGFTGSKMMLGADLRNIRVEGHVFLRGGYEAHGPVLLRDAKIEGTLDLKGAVFRYDGKSRTGPFWKDAQGDCLGLSRAEASALLWSDMIPRDAASHPSDIEALRPQGLVTLRDLKVRSFRHGMHEHGLAAWPQVETEADQRPGKGRLVLDGFVYDHITDAPCQTFLDWLALQRSLASPSPYFTLASVLQKQGLKDDAVRVRARARRNEVEGYGQPKRFFAKLVFLPVNYGASPAPALGLMLGLLILYGAIVEGLNSSGRMTPAAGSLLFNPCYYGHSTCRDDLTNWKQVSISGSAARYVPADYPDLSAVQYSLEAFVPVFDFGQRDHWQPASGWVQLALSVIELFGLFFGSLFFAAVTGLMRPREG